MRWAALRLQHRVDAPIGTVLDVSTDASAATRFRAKVVDENAVRMVTSIPPVLKGASIGGRVVRRSANDPRTVEALEWVELSLVDRPSCPLAREGVPNRRSRVRRE